MATDAGGEFMTMYEVFCVVIASVLLVFAVVGMTVFYLRAEKLERERQKTLVKICDDVKEIKEHLKK